MIEIMQTEIDVVLHVRENELLQAHRLLVHHLQVHRLQVHHHEVHHQVDDELTIVEIELFKDQILIEKWKNVIFDQKQIGNFVIEIVLIQI
jgi:hypothetical protein